MAASPNPVGTLEEGPNGPELQIHRSFNVPIETVWSAMTDSTQLERWIGRWEGDPGTGTVQFFMTAEGEDVEPEQVLIRECERPYRFAADTSVGEGAWHLRFVLRSEGDTTVLLFGQIVGEDQLGNIGPGWEYYLDRLARVLANEDVRSINWDDYFPAMSEYYEALR